MKLILIVSLIILLKKIFLSRCSVLYAANPLNAAFQPKNKDPHRLLKRMDLETCLAQFEVHKNAIIRTAESQAIGGKYLQGLELDTVDECQRLCCETDLCDVYIFEAKNYGYCYLFECGPPENFHCKFTRHANYTSAVLTPNRHVPEITTPRPTVAHISTPNIISQQELELTNLKVKPEVAQPETNLNNGPSPNAVVPQTPQQQQPQQMQPVQTKANTTHHCGRFQFMCHSGDCIAIYNACDGIPQCEDESDEGPECNGSPLGSGQKTSMATEAKALPQPSAPIALYPVPVVQNFSPEQQLQNVQIQQQQPAAILTPPMINNREEPDTWVNRKILTGSPPMDPINSGDLNNHIFNHKGGIQVPGNTNTNQMNTYTSGYANLNPMYNVAVQQQQQPQQLQQKQQNNGIFVPPPAQNAPNSGIIYGGPNVDPPALLHQQQGNIVMPSNVNWQSQQNLVPSVNQQLNQQQHQPQQYQQEQLTPMAAFMPQQNVIVSHQQQQPSPQLQNHPLIGQQPLIPPAMMQQNHALMQPANNGASVPQTVVSIASNLPSEKQNVQKTTSHESNENDDTNPEDEEDEEDEAAEKSTLPPKKKQRKHKKPKTTKDSSADNTNQQNKNQDKTQDSSSKAAQQVAYQNVGLVPAAVVPVHEKYKMVHENLGLEFRDHDGLSERPGGAVLSLTLGVLVTAALSILIGCRMRTVSRRSRRLGGKTPYSHEADFLVNGMYL